MEVNSLSEVMLENLKERLSDDYIYSIRERGQEENRLPFGYVNNMAEVSGHLPGTIPSAPFASLTQSSRRHMSLVVTNQEKFFHSRNRLPVNGNDVKFGGNSPSSRLNGSKRNSITFAELHKLRSKPAKRFSLDDTDMLARRHRDSMGAGVTGAATYYRHARRPSLYQEKEAAMLNLSLDSKMWSMKQSLSKMGTPPKGSMQLKQRQTTKFPAQNQQSDASEYQAGNGAAKRRWRTISKRVSRLSGGDDLGVIAENSELEHSIDLTGYTRGGAMSDSDSSIGLNASRRSFARQRKRRGKLGRKWKRLSKFLTLFFNLWRIHAAKVKNFLDTNVDLIEIQEPVDLMFDVTEYKADKQACVSQETKRILQKPPDSRSPEEVKHVQVALRNYQSIEEYPIKMTSRLAEKAWYEKFDRKRIVIQQNHPARCYYFILSGSVIVSRMDGEYSVSRTVCFLNRGESFGELGLINNAPRQATVISKEPVELLVINDEDFVEIFMGGGIKGTGDNFVENLWCFEGWPIEILSDYPSDSFLSYFKRKAVLVHDSKVSEWIYIVKTGSCRVIKKLKQVSPSRSKKTNNNTMVQEEDDHQHRLEAAVIAMNTKGTKRSLHFRQKQLNELKLGVEMIPLSEDQAKEEEILEQDETLEEDDKTIVVPEIHIENNSENDNTEKSTNSEESEKPDVANSGELEVISEEVAPTSSVDTEQTKLQKEPEQAVRKISVVQQLQQHVAKRRNSLSGPFLNKPQADNKSKAVRKKSVNSKVNSGQPTSPKRKISSEKTPAVQSEGNLNNHSLEDITHNPTVQDTVEDDDEVTARIRREFDEIIRGDTNRWKKSYEPEKKTITDELNKTYLVQQQLGEHKEEKHPTFVTVQTLTKGAVFGMADFVHADQPSLSLVSNGAECIVIRKKFFLDHCSQSLMNKIRQEISPFPRSEEIQENLNTYVNWVSEKQQTVKDAVLHNRVKKVDLNDARSVLTMKQDSVQDYITPII